MIWNGEVSIQKIFATSGSPARRRESTAAGYPRLSLHRTPSQERCHRSRCGCRTDIRQRHAGMNRTLSTPCTPSWKRLPHPLPCRCFPQLWTRQAMEYQPGSAQKTVFANLAQTHPPKPKHRCYCCSAAYTRSNGDLQGRMSRTTRVFCPRYTDGPCWPWHHSLSAAPSCCYCYCCVAVVMKSGGAGCGGCRC
jgi:hypothetical protein